MRILLVLDFSPSSARKLDRLLNEKWPEGSVLRLIGVVEKIPPSAAELWIDAEGDLQAVWKARTGRVSDLVTAAALRLEEKGWSVETCVIMGRRRRIVAMEAKSWRADLLLA